MITLPENKAKKPKPKKVYKYPDMTTIALTKEHAAALNKMKRNWDESYDNILDRLFINQVDVWVEFLLIDNELPQLHTAVFQLGDDKTSLYYWDGSEMKPFSLEESNKLMKQPKDILSLSLSRKEAIFIQGLLCQQLVVPKVNVDEWLLMDKQLENKLKNFLENQPK